jgi:hypothetical protein
MAGFSSLRFVMAGYGEKSKQTIVPQLPDHAEVGVQRLVEHDEGESV